MLSFLCLQGDLVKGLASSDPQASSQAITRADAYLEKSGRKKEEEQGGERSNGVVVQDRTVINRRQDSSAAGIASNKSRMQVHWGLMPQESCEE